MGFISMLTTTWQKYTTGQIRCTDCGYTATTERAIVDSLHAADDDQPAVEARSVDSCPECGSEQLCSAITGGDPS